jgi:hypothetical protein
MKHTRPAALVGVGIGAAAILATTAALAATAASAAPSRPAVPSCSSENMRVWTGFPGDGFAGGVRWQLEISNVGSHACTLFGYPGVSALNGAFHQVGLPASHSGPRSLVTIPARGTAHVELTVTDPGAECAGSHPVHGTLLRVFAPNQFHAELTPFSVAVCPHKVSMHVNAVHAGAGIPGFSTS